MTDTYRRWWQTGPRSDAYANSLCGPYINCPFCRGRAEFVPIAFTAIGDYVSHYADQHMGLTGLASPGDICRQTILWDEERAALERRKAKMQSNSIEPRFFFRGIYSNRPKNLGGLNLD